MLYGAACASRGVSWAAKSKGWQVFTWIKGKQQYWGSFEDEREAARTYDCEIIRHAGSGA